MDLAEEEFRVKAGDVRDERGPENPEDASLGCYVGFLLGEDAGLYLRSQPQGPPRYRPMNENFVWQRTEPTLPLPQTGSPATSIRPPHLDKVRRSMQEGQQVGAELTREILEFGQRIRDRTQTRRDGEYLQLRLFDPILDDEDEEDDPISFLVWMIPMAIWGHRLARTDEGYRCLMDLVYDEANRLSIDYTQIGASLAYLTALVELILKCEYPKDSPQYRYRHQIAFEQATLATKDTSVLAWLELARQIASGQTEPIPYLDSSDPPSHVLMYPFVHSFVDLLLQTSYQKGLKDCLAGGGRVTFNGAIIGGLLGALHGIHHLDVDPLIENRHLNLILELQHQAPRPARPLLQRIFRRH